jgi:acetate kinase
MPSSTCSITIAGSRGCPASATTSATCSPADDPRARLALDYFVYRAGAALGSLAASLEGLDAVVFTAGIGENAPAIRARICQKARWLGIDLDEAANADGARLISTGASRVRVYVIPTDEERMIAHHTLEILRRWHQR